MDWHYQQVEQVLVEALNVREDHRKAFRARLRHFRNLGIPAVSTPGKGRAVRFTEDHLSELVVAVLLARAGIGPLTMRDTITKNRRFMVKKCRDAIKSAKPIYMAVLPATFGGMVGEKTTIGIFYGSRKEVMGNVYESVDAPMMRTAVLINLSANLKNVFALASSKVR